MPLLSVQGRQSNQRSLVQACSSMSSVDRLYIDLRSPQLQASFCCFSFSPFFADSLLVLDEDIFTSSCLPKAASPKDDQTRWH